MAEGIELGHLIDILAPTLQVTANKELQGVVVTGANTLPARLVEDAFGDQYGATLNFGRFGQSLDALNKWYEDRDIVGQVSNHLVTVISRHQSTGIHPASGFSPRHAG